MVINFFLKYRMHLQQLKKNNNTLRTNHTLLWKQHTELFPLWLEEKVWANTLFNLY